MWPFKSKPKPPPEKHWTEVGHDRLLATFDLGETFQYLGRTCVVTGYFKFDGFWLCPSLVCDYADEHGVIREIIFRVDEAERLSQGKEKVQP